MELACRCAKMLTGADHFTARARRPVELFHFQITCRSWLRAAGSLELILHLLPPGLGAALVAFLIVAADADAADRFVTHLDRIAAAERDDIGEEPLAGGFLTGLGAVAPFQRRA